MKILKKNLPRIIFSISISDSVESHQIDIFGMLEKFELKIKFSIFSK